METGASEKPHSWEFFGPERDHWWNRDYLALIASRLELDGVRSVLDVGCGIGHWGRVLGSVLHPDASFVGLDREPRWLSRAAELADQQALGDRFQYEQGTAQALPFADESFDLVTCQTLLMHVPSPELVIREMLRVLKPGGVFLAAEPNNRASLLVDDTTPTPIEQFIDRLRFWLVCEQGKAALGEGNNSVGDLLPGLLAEQGAGSIETFIADKAAVLVPPYHRPDQQALREYALKEAADNTWGWTRADARRYFIAGGGTEADFDRGWADRLREIHERAAAISNHSLHTAGGRLLYIVAARKAKARGAEH
jgi:ubiquinone/menaquinone biosynthesis C-methylase UbiE